MFNQEAYLQKQDHLSFEQAVAIYNELLSAADLEDADFLDMWADVRDAASAYIKIRSDWNWMTSDEKLAADTTRTRKHDGFIQTLVPLLSYMSQRGWDVSWATDLGGLESGNRKRLGDFAGYLFAIGSLQAR